MDTRNIGEAGHVAWVKGFVSGPREIGGDYGLLIEAIKDRVTGRYAIGHGRNGGFKTHGRMTGR